MAPQESENEDNARLRRAQLFVANCQANEDETRRSLAIAEVYTKRARQKLNDLFIECERRACERRRSGQIVNNPGY